MATYTVAITEIGAHAKTLVANTQDTVSITRDCRRVEIYSDGAAEMYVSVNGATVDVTDPGNQAFEYFPALPCARTLDAPDGNPTVVKLKSTGTPKYSVRGVN